MLRGNIDRRVHGETADGWEVVRYDRAGKWFLERPDGAWPRRAVSVRTAAYMTDVHYPGLSGGRIFDAIVRRQA